jgi:Tol biopolymer transport system component
MITFWTAIAVRTLVALDSVGVQDVSRPQILLRPTDPGKVKLVCPAFSPDGKRIACTMAESSAGHIYAMPVVIERDGSRARVLEVPGFVENLNGLAWSRDGKVLGLKLYRSAPLESELWVVDVNTGQGHAVMPANSRFLPQNPTFSPDGGSLLATDSLTQGLLLCDVRERHVQSLPGARAVPRLAYCWAPDGALWYVESEVGGSSLLRRDLKAGSTERFSAPNSVQVLTSAPAAGLLACLSEVGEGQYRVFVFRHDRGTFTEMVAVTDRQVAWAPDSRALACISKGRVVVVDVGSGDQRVASPGGVEVSSPMWCPEDGGLWCVVGGRALSVLENGSIREVWRVGPLASEVSGSPATREAQPEQPPGK